MTDIHQADFCKVIPAKFSGSKEVVPLQIKKLVSSGALLIAYWWLQPWPCAYLINNANWGFNENSFVSRVAMSVL